MPSAIVPFAWRSTRMRTRRARTPNRRAGAGIESNTQKMVDAVDFARFGRLGIIASMQPSHGTPDALRIDSWSRSVGPERASRGWPYRQILESDGRLAFGSDWPMGALNPMLGLHSAVTRTTPEGEPEGGWFPAQRLALTSAVDAYTSGAAWASFDEQRKGTIAKGHARRSRGDDVRYLHRAAIQARPPPPSRLRSSMAASSTGARTAERTDPFQFPTANC